MIRTENEYQQAVQRLREEQDRLAAHKVRLEEVLLAPDEVERALEPLLSFHAQLAEEVEGYERLKRGDIGALSNLHGLGRTLVALRIALNLTQRELAERLGVHESQVSRDERNEYHGVTVERAGRILDALGVDLRSAFEEPLSTRKGSPPSQTDEQTGPNR
jgi:DNA-directed RNA polymerase specialized sigma subunit